MLTRRDTLRTTALTTALVAGSSVLPLTGAAFAQTVDIPKLMEQGSLPDKIVGEDSAPVTIIEYASMTCPHCATFHTDVYPQLKEKYVDTGKVRFVFREFPLDRLAAAASMLARCVEDDKFFPFIDVLFREQGNWVSRDPIDPLKKLSKQAGLSEEAFDKCLANQELLDGVVWIKDRATEEFEVRSTPTFFVNGQLVRGGQSIDEFEEIIDGFIGG